MAANPSSHGGAWTNRLLLLILLVTSAAALRPKSAKRKVHTLEDSLIGDIAKADVEHNDAMRFVREGIAYMERLGIKLSEECERRYGYTYIADQKYHHFRLCKSAARLENGTLRGVQRGQSALSKFRVRLEKKTKTRKERKAQAAAAKLANATNATDATAATAGARRGLLNLDPARLTAGGADLRAREAALEHLGSQERQRMPSVGELSQLSAHQGPDCHGGGRSLQAAGNSSANNLMYKILKFVNEKKDDGGDTSSDVYNDDDGEDADDAKEAVSEEENDITTANSTSTSSSTTSGGGANSTTGAAAATAASAAEEAERLRRKEAWLSKRKAALGEVIEPDRELPELTAVGHSHKSSVGCYLQPSMPRNIGYKDAQLLCVGRNVVLDTCAFYDGQNEEFDIRFPKPRVGAVKLGCSVNVPILGEQNYTKGYKNRLWWLNAVDNAYDTVRQSCRPGSGRVVEHPVAFVLRDRYTHTLHELEVLATIFTSLAVADLPEVREKGVQIVIADQMPHASYRPTYAAISYPYRLRHLAEAPYPSNTCFRTVLFINAFTNSIAFNPNTNTSSCFSPVMIGVHRWLRTLHQELDPAYLARVHQHTSETGGIVRRAVVWTSRRNLEALRLTSGVGMTEWQSARMVPNENQVVTAMQSAILEWNSRSCLLARYYGGDEGLVGCRASTVQFDLVFGEFSDWPYYPDQLMTIYRTGILIGVHGAALTFVASATAGESALLELAGLGWEETQTGNMLNLFPSLAHNMGAYYEQVRYQGPDIDVKIATDALNRAMDEVSQRIMANQARAKKGAEEPRFNDQYNFDVKFPHACPTSVRNKTRRFVTNHPVQMDLNATNSSGASDATDTKGGIR